MHEFVGVRHDGPHRLGDRLMSQADAEQGLAGLEHHRDDRDAHAGS